MLLALRIAVGDALHTTVGDVDALDAAVTGEKTTAVATISNPKSDMGEF